MCNKSLIAAFLLYLCFDHASMVAHRNQQLRFNAVSFIVRLDWDFLIFTQQWPSSMCKVWTHNNPKHHCTFPKNPNSWTVHGIWPTKQGTKLPVNCNKTWLFDPEQIRPIESELEQAWTNIEKETQLYNLWAHEWNKHGTCAAVIEPFNSQLKYFSKGIEFLEKYQMDNMLKAANIIPSNEKNFTVEDISHAVQSKISIRPVIVCEFVDGVQYLKELRICFDRNLYLMECEEMQVKDVRTNCDIRKDITYPVEVVKIKSRPPPKPKTSSFVQLYKFVNWVQWFTL